MYCAKKLILSALFLMGARISYSADDSLIHFDVEDPVHRATLTTIGSVLGGCAAFIALNKIKTINGFLPFLPTEQDQAFVYKALIAALLPGLCVADYNDDGSLNGSVFQGIAWWDVESRQAAWQACKSLISKAGFANFLGGLIGALGASLFIQP